jgi:DNA-binding IclR family transcriptional regulator
MLQYSSFSLLSILGGEYRTSSSGGPLAQKEIISRTDLPPTTVRYALAMLKDESVTKECFYLPDDRQSLYGLNMD